MPKLTSPHDLGVLDSLAKVLMLVSYGKYSAPITETEDGLTITPTVSVEGIQCVDDNVYKGIISWACSRGFLYGESEPTDFSDFEDILELCDDELNKIDWKGLLKNPSKHYVSEELEHVTVLDVSALTGGKYSTEISDIFPSWAGIAALTHIFMSELSDQFTPQLYMLRVKHSPFLDNQIHLKKFEEWSKGTNLEFRLDSYNSLVGVRNNAELISKEVALGRAENSFYKDVAQTYSKDNPPYNEGDVVCYYDLENSEAHLAVVGKAMDNGLSLTIYNIRTAGEGLMSLSRIPLQDHNRFAEQLYKGINSRSVFLSYTAIDASRARVQYRTALLTPVSFADKVEVRLSEQEIQQIPEAVLAGNDSLSYFHCETVYGERVGYQVLLRETDAVRFLLDLAGVRYNSDSLGVRLTSLGD